MATITSVQYDPGPSAPTDNQHITDQVVPVAQIVIRDITSTDGEGKFTMADEDPFGIFVDYIINNHFEKDLRRYMAGVSSPNGFQGNSVAFFQMSSSTLLWISDWTASRTNSHPKIPNPDPSDSNWVLLDEWYTPAVMSLGPDGVTPLYRISGTYVYGHRNPNPQTIANINYSRPPWMADDFSRTVEPGDLANNLNTV